jgi:hypothetical protein
VTKNSVRYKSRPIAKFIHRNKKDIPKNEFIGKKFPPEYYHLPHRKLEQDWQNERLNFFESDLGLSPRQIQDFLAINRERMDFEYQNYGHDKVDIDHCVYIELEYPKLWPTVITKSYNDEWRPYLKRQEDLLGKRKFKKFKKFCKKFAQRIMNEYGLDPDK